jgi:hypothetical protein
MSQNVNVTKGKRYTSLHSQRIFLAAVPEEIVHYR